MNQTSSVTVNEDDNGEADHSTNGIPTSPSSMIITFLCEQSWHERYEIHEEEGQGAFFFSNVLVHTPRVIENEEKTHQAEANKQTKNNFGVHVGAPMRFWLSKKLRHKLLILLCSSLPQGLEHAGGNWLFRLSFRMDDNGS